MTTPVESTDKLHDFHAELERLLRKQLELNPKLEDVRMRLLELFYEQHRAEDFLRAARDFRRVLKDPAASREWQRVASMGRMVLPGESLFSGHDSSVVEFVVEPTRSPAQHEAPKVRRFGDDESHRPLFDALAKRYAPLRAESRFLTEFEVLLVGLATRRPTPLFHVKRLSEHIGAAQIYLKREDLAGDSPHLTAAVTGQACLARRLGCKTLVAGTTDGRRGVVAAAAATRLGLRTLVFMDPTEAERHASQTLVMKLMGAELQLVNTSHLRNRDIREAALEHWAKNPDECFLVTGLDAAPPPYPIMTADFTSAIGRECRRQATAGGRTPPAMVVARGIHTADAIGLMPAFFADASTRLICVEPEKEPDEARQDIDVFNQAGMLSGSERKVARNILDRLEYPSVAREHALLHASGRVEYVETTRTAARQALLDLARHEGLVPPVETAHALAWACGAARDLKPEQSVIVLMGEQVAKDTWDIDRLVNPPATKPTAGRPR